MSNERDLTAKHILENIGQYSEDEIINAVRYLGRTKNADLLTSFLNPMTKAIFLMRTRLGARATWINVTLETIKQFNHLDDLTPFNFMIEMPTAFMDIHILEAIKIAGEKRNSFFLSEIAKNPTNFKDELRKKANEELFKPPQYVILEPLIYEPVRANKQRSNTEGKQIFVSYKKVDKVFTDEIVSFLTEFHSHEFEIIYDEFEIVAGDSLPQQLNSMLGRSESSIMIWTPEYFKEEGWAQIEKDTLLSRRVRDGKRFVPLFLKGKTSDIPPIFTHIVYVDFRDYEKDKNPVEFVKKMKEVIKGLEKEE